MGRVAIETKLVIIAKYEDGNLMCTLDILT